MKKTALYVRVSTEFQAEEGYSIEAQKKLLEAFCVSREIKNYEFYVDGGFSGSNLDRPRLKDLIRDVRDGKIDLVAVYKLDRLSRSQKDTLYLIEDVLNKYEVGFVSLSENMDTSTPIGRAMLGILSAFAQLERETIKIRTRMGMKERIKTGLWMGGGKVPFGYDYDKEKGILVPNEDAETVREIYDMFLAGMSPMSIANLLGLKYEKLVTQILTRKTNIGIITYKGEEFEGKHEGIVEKEVFYKALDEMKRRSRGQRSFSPHLLSGLIFCGECGARMRYQKWGKNGYKLVCYSKQSSKPYLVHDPNCKSENVWADEVEKEVEQDIFSIKIDKGEKVKEDKRKDNDKRVERIERKLKRLYELWADGNDALLDVIKDTERTLLFEKEKVKEANLKESEKRREEERMNEINEVRDVWEDLDDEEKRKVIRSVIEKIVVFKNRINIYYRF